MEVISILRQIKDGGGVYFIALVGSKSFSMCYSTRSHVHRSIRPRAPSGGKLFTQRVVDGSSLLGWIDVNAVDVETRVDLGKEVLVSVVLVKIETGPAEAAWYERR